MKHRGCFGWRVKVAGGLALLASITAAVLPAQAAPLRKGSILLGGPGGSAVCEFSPNCRAWVASDCNPAFLQADNAVASSIVDVSSIADGSTVRRLKVTVGTPTGVAPSGPSGVGIGFRSSACSSLSVSPAIPNPIKPGQTVSFKIPVAAKWMAVTGGAVANLLWTLE